jgi:hypothetical protein
MALHHKETSIEQACNSVKYFSLLTFCSTMITIQENIPLNSQAQRCWCYTVVPELVKVDESTVLCGDISLLKNVSAGS